MISQVDQHLARGESIVLKPENRPSERPARVCLNLKPDCAHGFALRRPARADNTPAIRLYQWLGLETKGVCRRYIVVDGIVYGALRIARVT